MLVKTVIFWKNKIYLLKIFKSPNILKFKKIWRKELILKPTKSIELLVNLNWVELKLKEKLILIRTKLCSAQIYLVFFFKKKKTRTKFESWTNSEYFQLYVKSTWEIAAYALWHSITKPLMRMNHPTIG